MIKLGSYFDEYYQQINKEIHKQLSFEDFKCFENEFNINSTINIQGLSSLQHFLLNNYDIIKILYKM